MWKRLFYKILAILIFLFMTLSPVWSVLLVMKCEAKSWQDWRASYVQAVHIDALYRSAWKKVGLEVKYDKL